MDPPSRQAYAQQANARAAHAREPAQRALEDELRAMARRAGVGWLAWWRALPDGGQALVAEAGRAGGAVSANGAWEAGAPDSTLVDVDDGAALIGKLAFASAEDSRRQRALQPARLLQLDARQRRSLPGGRCTLLIDHRGEVVAHGADAVRWLDAPRRRALAGLDGAATEATAWLDGFRLDLESLRGHQDLRWCVRVSAPVAPRIGVAGLLSPTQRAVCALYALGLSAREIARERGCTGETVRTHLKAAYRRLGVCNRVELIARLRLE
jgi:DNA-binding CsgD family transcriptional regulator